MKINGYLNNNLSAYRSYGMTKKSDISSKNSLEEVQDNKTVDENITVKATETKNISKADEMAAFKQEIYNELAEINSMNSSSVLSNTVHITEDGFQRMKDDPAYRKEIMDWLREDARVSHKLAGFPFDSRVTTTITGDGAKSTGINVYHDDSPEVKEEKKKLAHTNLENAFFHYDSTERKDKNIDFDKLWLQDKENRELLQRKLFSEKFDQKNQRHSINNNIIKNYGSYTAGNPKTWSI